MQQALIRQWQTAALLLLVLGFTLGAVSLPGSPYPTPALDWLSVLVPFGASAASMRLGRHRLAALCGVAGACAGALLFWWTLAAAAGGILATGLTTTTLEAGVLASLLVGMTATISGAAGALWQLPDVPQRRALIARSTDQATIAAGPAGWD